MAVAVLMIGCGGDKTIKPEGTDGDVRVGGPGSGFGPDGRPIGANFPQKRELDDEAVGRAGLVVADSREQSMLEAGDLIRALGDDPGRWSVVRELSEVVAGGTAGRTNPRQITLFKSNGIAIEDVMAAVRVYEAARAQEVGQEVPLWV